MDPRRSPTTLYVQSPFYFGEQDDDCCQREPTSDGCAGNLAAAASRIHAFRIDDSVLAELGVDNRRILDHRDHSRIDCRALDQLGSKSINVVLPDRAPVGSEQAILQ